MIIVPLTLILFTTRSVAASFYPCWSGGLSSFLGHSLSQRCFAVPSSCPCSPLSLWCLHWALMHQSHSHRNNLGAWGSCCRAGNKSFATDESVSFQNLLLDQILPKSCFVSSNSRGLPQVILTAAGINKLCKWSSLYIYFYSFFQQ